MLLTNLEMVTQVQHAYHIICKIWIFKITNTICVWTTCSQVMAQWFFFTSAPTSNSCDFSKLKHRSFVINAVSFLLCSWTLLINYSCLLLYKSNYHWHSTKSKQCIFSKHILHYYNKQKSQKKCHGFLDNGLYSQMPH